MSDEPARPYRLWDAQAKEYLQWRYYKYPRNAHLGALIEARWAKPGTVIEVLDIRGEQLLGQYRRTPTSVTFTQVKKDQPE
jgi:hypothetical protein